MGPITHEVQNGKYFKSWTRGVEMYFDPATVEQVSRIASMPFVTPYVAVMPDAHAGIGSSVGCVIPTQGAIFPAAVGVDIGCGMIAAKIDMTINELHERRDELFAAITRAVPMGRSSYDWKQDCGSWNDERRIPDHVTTTWWQELAPRWEEIASEYPEIRKSNQYYHLGTLGGGNHFLELSVSESGGVWIVIHSGSRGVGNKIGTTFIKAAQEECARYFIELPHQDLAYLVEGAVLFEGYITALSWAQDFAKFNRLCMLQSVLNEIGATEDETHRVHCHHNYTEIENHGGKNLWITRKGAIRARETDMGIIPGSMGARTYIVKGKGNPESFCSASHGAGRQMSRMEAKRRFSKDDLATQTDGVTCRKDGEVVDEIPSAYKPIERVMAAQSDLVEIKDIVKQVVCCKG